MRAIDIIKAYAQKNNLTAQQTIDELCTFIDVMSQTEDLAEYIEDIEADQQARED